MTPFPGTPLHDRLEQSGRLLQPNAWELCTLFDVNFQPDGMTIEELERDFRMLVSELYSESATAGRRKAFSRQLRQARKQERARKAGRYV